MPKCANGAKRRPKSALSSGARTCSEVANAPVADIFLALLHHPVVDRHQRIVTSSITSLDIHDLARSSCTFGVRAFFIVHPVAEQREFAATVIDHWRFDFGRSFDSRRREALDLVQIVADLDAA